MVNGIEADCVVCLGNYDTLIKLMTILQKDQITQGTGKNIAEILINNFGVKLSLSTITTKFYRFSEELNEEIFFKETFTLFVKNLDNTIINKYLKN